MQSVDKIEILYGNIYMSRLGNTLICSALKHDMAEVVVLLRRLPPIDGVDTGPLSLNDVGKDPLITKDFPNDLCAKAVQHCRSRSSPVSHSRGSNASSPCRFIESGVVGVCTGVGDVPCGDEVADGSPDTMERPPTGISWLRK